MKIEKPLPHDDNAERAVLSCLFIDNESINEILDKINQSDFFKTPHAYIYYYMVKLYEEKGKFDLITIVSELKKIKKLKDCGGPGYIASLSDVVPTAVNITHYSDIVKKLSVARQSIQTAYRFADETLNGDNDIQESLSQLESKIMKLNEGMITTDINRLSDILKDILERLDEVSKKDDKITGIACGHTDIDNLTFGFQDSDLIILAARPSVGKSTLLGNWIEYIAIKQEIPSLLFSLEMNKESFCQRILSSQSEVNFSNIRSGYLSAIDWNKIKDGTNKIHNAPFWVDETGGTNIIEIRAKARRMVNRHGIKIVFLDYLQLVDGINVKSGYETVTQVSHGLKNLAKELKIPIIAAAQLNRKVDERRDKEPRFSDLRESGNIEQDMDLGFFMWNEQQEMTMNNEVVVNVGLKKQRNGPTGTTKLMLRQQFCQFVSMANHDEDYVPF